MKRRLKSLREMSSRHRYILVRSVKEKRKKRRSVFLFSGLTEYVMSGFLITFLVCTKQAILEPMHFNTCSTLSIVSYIVHASYTSLPAQSTAIYIHMY